MRIPSILLFKPFQKGFVKAATYTTKKGKTINRRAYTDSRKAKEYKAKDKINRPWTKNKTYKQVKTDLHSKRKQLHSDIEEIRKHQDEIKIAKVQGDTHTKRGIKVDQAHHVDRHHDNLMEKLEHTNNKIMLHDRHVELEDEKREERKEKRVTKRIVVKKKLIVEGKKDKLPDSFLHENIRIVSDKLGTLDSVLSLEREEKSESKKQIDSGRFVVSGRALGGRVHGRFKTRQEAIDYAIREVEIKAAKRKSYTGIKDFKIRHKETRELRGQWIKENAEPK